MAVRSIISRVVATDPEVESESESDLIVLHGDAHLRTDVFHVPRDLLRVGVALTAVHGL
jgi:hypothetical protein